ncbi:MAG: DUF1559 domain-containing protein [Singulisphaera sp.]
MKPGSLAVAAESTWVTDHPRPRRPGILAEALRPLWDQADAYAIGIDASRRSRSTPSTCNSDDDAKQVAATVEASLTLARNMVQGLSPKRPPSAESHAEGGLGRRGRAPLESRGRALLQGGSRRTRRSDGPPPAATGINPADVVKLVLSPPLCITHRGRRAQSVDNLKQIGLAMHKYHEAKNHFPPAIGFGPDGKTTHSWRVAILPYLERQELYNAYRFDEPWDSPSNRKVLEKMPDFYRAPDAGGDPTHPSYFAVTGPRPSSRMRRDFDRSDHRRDHEYDHGRRGRARHPLDQARGHPLRRGEAVARAGWVFSQHLQRGLRDGRSKPSSPASRAVLGHSSPRPVAR